MWLVIALVLTHLGLGLLVAFASGWPRRRRERAPEIDRNPVEPFGAAVRLFLRADAGGRRRSPSSSPAAGSDRSTASRRWWCCPASRWWSPPATSVPLYRERMVSSTWLGLLVAPPVLIVLGIALLPWTFAVDLKVSQPANAEGRFFADNFQRRTGQPLGYVTGDARFAPLVALGSPSRPHVYFDWAPERSPWASPADIAQARRHPGLAGRRQRRHAAGGAQGAIPRHGAGSAALVRALDAGPVAADPARLGGAGRRCDASALSDSSRLRAPCRGTASR